MGFLRFLHPCLAGLVAGTTVLAAGAPGMAAERVVVKMGFFRESVSVEELATFAETGTLSPALESYVAMSNADPQEVRRILTKEVAIDPVTLDRALNSLPGNLVLDQLGEAIQTPTGAANRQALRSALVLSASKDRNVTLLETLQNYPTEEVHLDGKRLVNAYNQISRLAEQVQKIMGVIDLLK